MQEDEIVLTPLAEAGGTLKWRQQKGQDLVWVLTDGQKNKLIRLYWPVNHNGTALAETADGTYTLKRQSVPRRAVQIQKDGEQAPAASLVMGWFGRSYLWIEEEKKYPWAPVNFWRGSWAFTDEQGLRVMRLKTWRKKRRYPAVRVNFDPALLGTPELPLLLLCGGYQLACLSAKED